MLRQIASYLSPAGARAVQLAGSQPRYLIAGLVAFTLIVLYNTTLPTNLTASHDSLSYLETIEASDSPWLFHPHHLLYAVIGWSFWHLWQLVGYAGDALLPLQELNIIFASASIAILYLLLQKVWGNTARSLLVCSAVAVSYGPWFYSGTVEVYIIPLFFLIVSFALAYLTLSNPSLKLFVLLGAANALAVLFHQMNVLFVFVVLTAVLVNGRLPSARMKFRAIASYGVFLILPVATVYLLALGFVVKPTSFETAYGWFTTQFQAGLWGEPDSSSPLRAVSGLSNAFVGGHFLLSIEPFARAIERVLGSYYLETQQAIAQYSSNLRAYFLLVTSLPVLAAVAYSLVSYMRRGKSVWREHRLLLALSLAWFLPYALFTSWWEPANLEFWIAPTIPFWIIVSLPFFTMHSKSAPRWARAGRLLLPLAVGCLFFVNLLGSMLPLHTNTYDHYFQRAIWYTENVGESDLIIVSRQWLWGSYLERFTAADIVGVAELLTTAKPVDEEPHDLIDRIIRQKLDDGATVYITSDAVDPDAVTLEAYRVTAADFSNLWENHRRSWYVVDIQNEDKVYVLDTVE